MGFAWRTSSSRPQPQRERKRESPRAAYHVVREDLRRRNAPLRLVRSGSILPRGMPGYQDPPATFRGRLIVAQIIWIRWL